MRVFIGHRFPNREAGGAAGGGELRELLHEYEQYDEEASCQFAAIFDEDCWLRQEVLVAKWADVTINSCRTFVVVLSNKNRFCEELLVAKNVDVVVQFDRT